MEASRRAVENSLGANPARCPDNDVEQRCKGLARRRRWQVDSRGRGHCVRLDLRVDGLEWPGVVVDLRAIDVPCVRRVEAVPLTEPVVERAGGARCHGTTRTISRGEGGAFATRIGPCARV